MQQTPVPGSETFGLMNHFDELEDFRKQIGKYFDHALDPKAQESFLQQVQNNPRYLQAFQQEQSARDNLKKHIYRPETSSQLVQAIKNQIRKP